MTALARQQFLRPRRSRNEVQLPTEINHLQQKGGTYAENLTIGHDRRNACRIRASGARTRARQRPQSGWHVSMQPRAGAMPSSDILHFAEWSGTGDQGQAVRLPTTK